MPAPSSEPIWDRLAGAVGAVGHRVIRRTDKTVLVSAALDGRPVVVKILVDSDEFWRQKLANEVAAYRTFATKPPPIRVPELVHADERNSLLVLTWVDGQPLDIERYAAPVTSDNVDAVLSAVQALTAWRPPADSFGRVLNFHERVERYRDQGFLNAKDAKALTALLARCGDRWEFNHGDLVPNNLLVTPDGRCALLDWEFAGLYLPGFDLALLHTTLSATPYAQHQIEQIITARNLDEPFAVNRAMVLTRELRIHSELPPSQWRDDRSRTIEALWRDTRHQLHQVDR